MLTITDLTAIAGLVPVVISLLVYIKNKGGNITYVETSRNRAVK